MLQSGASDEMKNNYQVVIAAVTQDGRALTYNSDDAKRHFGVVLVASRQHPVAVKHVSQDFIIAIVICCH